MISLPINNELKLQQLELPNAVPIFNLINSQREYLGKWLPFVEFTKELSDTERFVNSIVNSPQDKFEFVFTIRKSEECIGLVGFKDTDRLNKKTEIGYWLSEKCQKQGIVTKVVEKLCNFAFAELGMNRIQIKCAVGNEPSRKVPQRLGFKFEGIERQGELLTGGVYADLENL